MCQALLAGFFVVFVYSERDILINYTLYLANNYAFIRLHPDTGKGPRICEGRFTHSFCLAIINSTAITLTASDRKDTHEVAFAPELTERAKKLRSQCAMQAQALKQRIEMRINRVPKKLWDVTMGELLAQHGPIAVADGLVSAKLNSAAVKEFVEDVKRLSGGEEE
ncbi:uncharacterized protein LAJ45_06214 [Morchella importuna]|uniref:uncharacterized protein n=1 Tax=Morchella importuna TaxID=1174673 RepID=UPI001E8DAAF9|nr:uncharacterized protein LAJ45_06214 [Morchella importuna]KAH8149585.1 hypothetical protein LAJ45_06214 [Morchella importuna]